MADKAQIIVEAVDKASSVFKGIGGAIEGVAKMAAGVATAGIGAMVAGIGASIGVAQEFEVGMNNFKAAAGGALEEAGMKTKEFEKLFLDLGKKLPVSTMEVADAATALVKGGLEPAVIAAGGLESTLKFAAAAQMDLVAAAEVGIKQLSIFTDVNATAAEKTAFLAKSQDLLVKAAGASTTDVAQLSDAILMSAGQAKAAGLEYEDFITAITMVSDKMPSAAEAGTSFKNMLTRLTPTTKEAKMAFKDLGLMTFDTTAAMKTLRANGIDPTNMSQTEMVVGLKKLAAATGMTKDETTKYMNAFNKSAFYDAQGNFVGMREAAKQLKEAFKDLTEEDRIRYAQMLFGNDGMAAAMALIEGGTDAYDKYSSSIDKANGVNEQSAALQQGLAFAVENAKGSLEAFGIMIGTKFLPIATDIVNRFITPAINGLSDLVGAFDPLMAFLTKDSAIGFQQFENIMSKVFGPTAAIKISGFVQNAKNLLSGFQAWINGDMFGGAAMGMGLMKMFGPEAGAKIATFLQDARGLIEGFVGWLSGSMSGSVGFATALVDAFGPETAKVIWDFVNGARKAIGNMISWVQANWPAIQTAIGDVINTVKGYIDTILIPAIGVIISTAGAVVSWIQANWPQIQTIVQGVIDAVAGFINTQLVPALQTISMYAGMVVDWLKANWPNIQLIISDVVNAVKDILTNVLIPIFGAVIGAAGLLVKWIVENWPQIREVIKFIVDAVVKKLEEMKKTVLLAFDQAKAIGNLIGEVKTAVETKWAEIKTYVDGLPKAFFDAGQNIVQGIINGVKNRLTAFGDLWKRFVDDPIGTLEKGWDIHSPSGVMFDMGENIMKGLIYGVQSYRNKAVTVMEEVAQAVTDAAAGVYQTPVGIVNAAAGDDSHDRRGGAVASTMAAAGNAMTGTLPQSFNATMTVNVMMDGAVLASTVISIVQGILQQEKARYGQP
jgi:phage-related protein